MSSTPSFASDGYKNTTVGVIPKDWRVEKISTVCTLINGRGFKPHEWDKEGLPIIRIQNLNGSTDFNYFSGRYDEKIKVESGELLFAWSGSVGSSFGPHIWNLETGLLNYHTWKVVINQDIVNRPFFLHALRNLTSFVESKAQGASALVHVQKMEMEAFEIAIPNSKIEQQKISIVLDDLDVLIHKMALLTRKLENIKMAIMNSLLSGIIRLPGFSSEWETLELGRLAKTTSGGTPDTTNSSYYGGEIPWVSISDITSAGKTIFSTERKLTLSGLSNSSSVLFPKNSILLAMYASIGECCIAGLELATSQAILGIVPKENLNHEYLYYYLISIKHNLRSLGQQGTQSNLNAEIVRSINVPLPGLNEQKAIANVLSDVDSKILISRAKLDKLNTIKQGMMQQLLTGKIRLVQPQTTLEDAQ